MFRLIKNNLITMSEAKIKIRENASYLVTGGVRLTRMEPVENDEGERENWKRGDDYPLKEKYSLCRCGHSKSKPYCDTTHKEIEFKGELSARREPSAARRLEYKGEGIVMTDDESLCGGFAFCEAYGSVWAEIQFSSESEIRQRVERQISLCPSGRLQYYLDAGKDPVELKYEPMISVIPNGPLWVLGGIPVEAPDGFVYEVRNRQLLCRCGNSSNKPFCDGSHTRSMFDG